jgi:hypothetical protein
MKWVKWKRWFRGTSPYLSSIPLTPFDGREKKSDPCRYDIVEVVDDSLLH